MNIFVCNDGIAVIKIFCFYIGNNLKHSVNIFYNYYYWYGYVLSININIDLT